MAPSADSFVLLSRAPCDLGPHVLAGCLYFPKPSRAHLSGESFFVRCDLALYIIAFCSSLLLSISSLVFPVCSSVCCGPKNWISLCLWRAWVSCYLLYRTLCYSGPGRAKPAWLWLEQSGPLVLGHGWRVCMCVFAQTNTHVWWLLFVSQPWALLARAQAWLIWMYKYTRLPSVCATSSTPLFLTTLQLQR